MPDINFDVQKEFDAQERAKAEAQVQTVTVVAEPATKQAGPASSNEKSQSVPLAKSAAEPVATMAVITPTTAPEKPREVPRFDFARWTRPDNRELHKLHASYLRKVTSAAILQTKASTNHSAGISGLGEEGERDTDARKMLEQAEKFDALAEEEISEAYKIETKMFQLMGKTILTVPPSWKMQGAPEQIDFTAAETYELYLRADRLNELLPAFAEARDSKN